MLSVIAAPTLLSVIDDKEVASDTWTSSLFTPHLRANGSLPWWDSDLKSLTSSAVQRELKKQDEQFVALAQTELRFILAEKVSFIGIYEVRADII